MQIKTAIILLWISPFAVFKRIDFLWSDVFTNAFLPIKGLQLFKMWFYASLFLSFLPTVTIFGVIAMSLSVGFKPYTNQKAVLLILARVKWILNEY